jgi:hypothetical protein
MNGEWTCVPAALGVLQGCVWVQQAPPGPACADNAQQNHFIAIIVKKTENLEKAGYSLQEFRGIPEF